MRIAGIPFYQANGTNFSRGRTRPIKKFTVHHSAGYEDTLRYLWADPNRNASSTFWVGNRAGQIEQYVDTDDTPWTNGNFNSNSESLTCEVRGDWRGFYDKATLDNLYTLIVKCLRIWPHLVLEFHQDVSTVFTLCPADLKHKGFARAEFDRAMRDLFTPPPAPKPTPAPVKPITYAPIAPKRVKLKNAASLWNFNFSSWGTAKSVGEYPAGHLVDVVAVATNGLGGKYYMTAYSYNNGSIRATNGFNINDCVDYVPAVTQPPTVELKWEDFINPRDMRLTIDTKVVNLNDMKEFGDTIAKGTDIALVDKKTVKPGEVYARSKWAKENGKNWGIKLEYFTEVPATPEVPREPVPEPPIDVDPDVPSDSDILGRLSILEYLVRKIMSFFGIKE
jgi:hypothetical protein